LQTKFVANSSLSVAGQVLRQSGMLVPILATHRQPIRDI